MKYHNEDIAACTYDKCPKRLTCLRWQLGTNKDPYQTYLDGSMCDEEFYVELNNKYTMTTKEEILNTFTSKEGAWYAYKEGIQIGYNEAYNSLRNQAAIAAMQGVMNFFGSIDYNRESIAKLAVEQADALIEELKKRYNYGNS